MKKMNRTYIMGIVCILFSFWIIAQTLQIPNRLVSNEPGPKLFPFISAAGIILFSVLSMVFDGKKEKSEQYLDKDGYKRLLLIMGECLGFAFCMNLIGFWITSILGLFLFIWTLKGDKKLNVVFAAVFCVILGSICYFGFTKGFNIPLPSGQIWKMLGVRLP